MVSNVRNVSLENGFLSPYTVTIDGDSAWLVTQKGLLSVLAFFNVQPRTAAQMKY